MKNRGGILTLFVIFLLISFYYLGRTWKVNDIRKDAVAYATGKDGKINPSKKQSYLDSLWKIPVLPTMLGGSTLEDLSKQELGLGLDLQGGMHVILEVSSADVIKALAGKSRDPKINEAIENARKAAMSSNTNFTDLFVAEFKKVAPSTKLKDVFLNKNNRDILSSNSTDGQVISYLKTEVDDAYKRSYNVIQNRVDKFGVANVNLSKIPGTNRIQVELPGIDNPERVRKLLTGVAKLQFCEVVVPQEIGGSFNKFSELLNKIDNENKVIKKDTGKTSDLASALRSKIDTLKNDSLNAKSLSNLFINNQFGGLAIKAKDTSRLNEILKRPDAAGIFPADISIIYNFKAEENENNLSNANTDIITVYLVKDLENAPLEGDVITNARKDSDQYGKRAISMSMNTLGARKWAELTKKVSLNQYSKQIAIVLDNYVYSAPSVKEEISGGNSIISGSFSPEEQADLENVLKAGKLPAPTNIIEEAVVGATVGSNALNAGIISSIIGLIAVLIFVMVYYNQAGWIANAALLINLVLLLGVMASFGATMTLPGIAGLVLSVGMSVDANVLIFERIKEEMIAGKSFVASIRDGFKHAMPSIIDSNVATLITGVILFIFGTGLVKGFATTLLIGIFTSLFCAVFVARLIFEYYIKRGKTINFKTAWTERLFKDSNIDFIKKRKTFYMISAAIVLAGIVSIGIRGFGLGVDFKGGRTYEAKFEKNVNTESIRKSVESIFPNTTVEVKTYGGFDKVKITSSYKIENTDVEVEKQIKQQLDKTIGAIAGNKGVVVASSKVGPTIANDTIWSSLKAILYSLIFVFIYIYIRFRSLAFGFGAVVALFHDVLVILGIFSILNGFLPFSLDIDQAFVGAVLTLMGYSMNDTVVVFDRIREYLSEKGAKKETMATTINNALNSTLSRTAVTGVATLLVLFILLIFGGETIRGFVFCMFIGVIVGTYSSLFIASPIVVDAMQRRLENEGDAIRASTSAAAKA
jgi:SecD/SecF fusion protein